MQGGSVSLLTYSFRPLSFFFFCVCVFCRLFCFNLLPKVRLVARRALRLPKFLTIYGYRCIVLNKRCHHYILPSSLGMRWRFILCTQVLIMLLHKQVPIFGKTCSWKAALFLFIHIQYFLIQAAFPSA